MSFRQAFLFFIGCWLIIFLTGIAFSFLLRFVSSGAYSPYSMLYPVVTMLTSYGSIWLLMVRKKATVFSMRDYVPFKMDFIVPVMVMVLGIQIANQPFLDLYNRIFFPGLEKLIESTPPESGLHLLSSFLSAVMIAPVAEEYLFRKIIFGQLCKTYTASDAVLVSSVFFSLIHLPLYGKLIPTFIIGCVSCMIYYHTGKLVYSILFHLLNNALAMIWDIFFPELWRAYTDLDFSFLYWLIAGSGIAIFGLGIRSFLRTETRENL